MNNRIFTKKKVKCAAAVAVLLILIPLAASSLVVIPTGYTGVVTNCGAVNGKVLPEGIHFKQPFLQRVVKMDNHILKVELPFTSTCKDAQTVIGNIAVCYQVRPESSASVYRKFGKSVESILVIPAIPACIRTVTARYTAKDLLTRLQAASEKIKDSIERKVQPYGLSIETLYVTDFRLPENDTDIPENQGESALPTASAGSQPEAENKDAFSKSLEQACAETDIYRMKNQEQNNGGTGIEETGETVSRTEAACDRTEISRILNQEDGGGDAE